MRDFSPLNGAVSRSSSRPARGKLAYGEVLPNFEAIRGVTLIGSSGVHLIESMLMPNLPDLSSK